MLLILMPFSCPGFFLFQLAYIILNRYEGKDLWCSSTAQLLSAYVVDMNGRVCGALVQLGCY